MPGRIYQRWAEYYDILYDRLVNYVGDVEFLDRTFRRYMGRTPRSLLDLGCGTGSHALLFGRRGYEVTGLDASRPMLALARRKAKGAGPRVQFVRGEMRSFRLGRTFDVAISLFGAFGYLLTDRDVLNCLASVRRHLPDGGLLAFEYWQTSGVKPGLQSWIHRRGDEGEIIRLSESTFDKRRDRLTIDFRFFIFKDDRILSRFRERHILRTYGRSEMGRLLRRGGFDLVAAFAVTPLEKKYERVLRETFRVMAIARPRAQS